MRDVTLEGQRHSEIIRAPRSKLPLCVCTLYRMCVCELHLQMITVKAGCTAVSYIWCGMSQLPLKSLRYQRHSGLCNHELADYCGNKVFYAFISFMLRILIMFQDVTSQEVKMISIFHHRINNRLMN